MVIFTIGHSTRSLEDLVRILTVYGIKNVADIRTIPRSQHNPQFNKETLPEELAQSGIGYLHMPGLGGLRHTRKDSPNAGWRNASFRGFADYMQTDEFYESLERLMDMAGKEKTVLMCAESLPWRCHRSLIADALAVRGARVKHIINEKSLKDHELTQWSVVREGRITYPPAS